MPQTLSKLILAFVLIVFSACSRGEEPQAVTADQSVGSSDSDVVQYDTSRVVPPPLPRKSPMAVTRATFGKTYVKIVYGVPLKRGRVVFGALEPFGQVWRLGANETTELTTTGPILFGDIELAPGTYSLFAVPEPDKWTIIVNSGLGQWGAYDYDEALDVGRISTRTQRTAKIYEAFTAWLANEDGGASIHFAWDQTEVVVPLGIL